MPIQTDIALGAMPLGHSGAKGRIAISHDHAGDPRAMAQKTEGQAPANPSADTLVQTPADVDALRLTSPTQTDHVAPPSIMQLKIAALQSERDAGTRSADIAPNTPASNPDDMLAKDPMGVAPTDVTVNTKP